MNYENLFSQNKEMNLKGRYITLIDIEPLLIKYNSDNQVQIIGESVLGKPIYKYELGTGKTKVLLWSQMHGNESTTTKALFDFLNLLNSNSDLAKNLLNEFTFCCLPMLNPDGALLYTRENANNIDLNRDAQNLTQPESKLLRSIFENFKPDYCYNLHDQRTIYGVGTDNIKPATVSFLAPAYNENRDINEGRAKAIKVIVAMNNILQEFIPNQVGRFDDSFNINCVGDTFQFLNVPTILIEAGHFQGDYDRDLTRKFVFIALVEGLKKIYENDIVNNKIEDYLNIPHNKICFYDFIYKNIKINYDNNKIITNFALQIKEELIDNQFVFNTYTAAIGDLEGFSGHFEYDVEEALYEDFEINIPNIDRKAEFSLGKSIKFVNGLKKN
ncbi:MAG: M14 family metallopeptidase [Flavobacterium sp.]|nr:M14 family metallopeptidase [Flavobacterium sp.]